MCKSTSLKKTIYIFILGKLYLYYVFSKQFSFLNVYAILFGIFIFIICKFCYEFLNMNFFITNTNRTKTHFCLDLGKTQDYESSDWTIGIETIYEEEKTITNNYFWAL